MPFLIFLFPIILSVIQFFLIAFVFPVESPIYLWIKDNRDQALNILNTLYIFNEEKLTVFDVNECTGGGLIVNWKDICSDSDKKRLLFYGILAAVLQQLVGINMLIMGSSYFVDHLAGIPNDTITLIIMSANCFFSTFLIFILDRGGYSTMLRIGGLGMSACYGVLIILQAVEARDVFNLIIVILFVAFFELSIGPIMWVYCADRLPDKAVAITTSVNWITAFLVYFVSITVLKVNKNNLIYFFALYMVPCILIAAFSNAYKSLKKRNPLLEDMLNFEPSKI